MVGIPSSGPSRLPYPGEPPGTDVLMLLPATDRRNVNSRRELLRRVRTAFDEQPSLRLTPPQAARLFGMRADICRRVMTSLIDDRVIWMAADGRYSLYLAERR